MATDSSRDPLRSEAAPLLKARGAASSLEGLVRLLARQAAREAIASRLKNSIVYFSNTVRESQLPNFRNASGDEPGASAPGQTANCLSLT
jgi:NAD(P)H-hydrate repair Nnr-like enzyme with NAD(P)H-hydrate dehydratase domain